MTTIHDRLAQILQGSQGQALSAKDIKERLLARFPDLNPLSVLPADHVAGPQQGKYCKLCKAQPLLEKLGHGVYRVREGLAPQFIPSYSIHEKLAQSLAGQEGQLLTPADLKGRVLEKFPDTHEASILPAEHVSGGPCRECAEAPLLERVGSRGLYRIQLGQPASQEGEALSPLPRQKLAALFSSHNPKELLCDIAKLEEQLQQQCGLEHLREIRLLVSAVRERIPFELQEYAALIPRETLHSRLVERLYKNWCFAREFGRWAVESWAQALAVQAGPLVEPQPAQARPAPREENLAAIQILWPSRDGQLWFNAHNSYWLYVTHHNLNRELDLNRLHQKVRQSRDMAKMGGWYSFLLTQYIPWFFTNQDNYIQNAGLFQQSYQQQPEAVDRVMDEVFALRERGARNQADITRLLEKVQELAGFGARAASGLLALLFPDEFGTATKYVKQALLLLEDLPEKQKIDKIEDWTTGEVALLIGIMRRKAAELNKLFNTREWTPRRIDMILFALRNLGPEALKAFPEVLNSLTFSSTSPVPQNAVN